MPRTRHTREETKHRKRVARQKSKRIKERHSIDLGAEAEERALDAKAQEPKAKLALRALFRRAQECRTDIAKFYEFVIREENTKAKLKIAPHQRLMFAFVLEHPECVLRMPIGCGKTFGMAAVALWLMGQDPTARGAVVSKTQGQASKVIRMMSDYITEPSLNQALTMVFPHLERSHRPGDVWTQNALTIKRPAAIRDATAIAVGLDGAIGGARLSWLVGDDILDVDNCLTIQAREQVHSRFDGRIMSRLDPKGYRAVVTNTPWHHQDMTFKLEGVGWPTLVMDIYGNIKFVNVSEEWILSTGLVRPSTKRKGWWRLVAHDPDPDEVVPLWPDRYPLSRIAELRKSRQPHEFARLYLCQPLDEGAARCRQEWIEACKQRGRGQWTGGPIGWNRANPVYTGVDIAVGTGTMHDESAMVTYELLEDGSRRLLEVDAGKWSGPELTQLIIDKHDRFGSIVTVESNSAQDFIRQFARAQRPDLRVRSHTTSQATKHNLDFGVESVFTEIRNAAWVFPCDKLGNSPSSHERLFEDCLFYQPPPAHTADRLMAMWIAREGARRGGGGRDPKPRAGLRLEFASGGGF